VPFEPFVVEIVQTWNETYPSIPILVWASQRFLYVQQARLHRSWPTQRWKREAYKVETGHNRLASCLPSVLDNRRRSTTAAGHHLVRDGIRRARSLWPVRSLAARKTTNTRTRSSPGHGLFYFGTLGCGVSKTRRRLRSTWRPLFRWKNGDYWLLPVIKNCESIAAAGTKIRDANFVAVSDKNHLSVVRLSKNRVITRR